MESEARYVPDLIGRRLSWLERQIFHIQLGGWRYWLILLGYLPRMVLVLPLALVWIVIAAGRGAERAEAGIQWLAELTKLERLPWSRQEGEPRDLWQIPRVTRALRRMGLLTQEAIDAHQPRPE